MSGYGNDPFQESLDEIRQRVAESKEKARRAGLKMLGLGARGALVLLALVLFLGSFFTVPQGSVGLIQRFGALSRTVEPGLHFKAPFGVERVTRVDVQGIRKQEFGFTTVDAGIQSTYTYTDQDKREATMLTGDLNIANVEWIVQYRVKDPELFTFHVRDVEETLRDLSEAVARRNVGDRSVTEVLTVGRTEIAVAMSEQLQKLLDEYETGIEVTTVQLQDVRPPGPVEPSFNEVNEARQEKERSINEAWALYNKEIPAAEGEATRVLAEAEGYALDRVNRATGEADRFRSVANEYRKAPKVTRRRLYIEAMDEILPKVGRLLVLDEDSPVTPILGLEGTMGKAVATKARGN